MASLRPPGKTYDRESVEESLDALRARRTFPEAGADVIVLRDAPATPRHRSRTQPGTTMQPDQFRCRPEAGVHRARLSNGFKAAFPKRLRNASDGRTLDEVLLAPPPDASHVAGAR